MGHAPPHWAVNTAVAQETAQTSRTPRLFIPGLALLLGPGLGLSVRSRAGRPELRVQPALKAGAPSCRSALNGVLTTSQWPVHWRRWVLLIGSEPVEARAWAGGRGQGPSPGFAVICYLTVVPGTP